MCSCPGLFWRYGIYIQGTTEALRLVVVLGLPRVERPRFTLEGVCSQERKRMCVFLPCASLRYLNNRCLFDICPATSVSGTISPASNGNATLGLVCLPKVKRRKGRNAFGSLGCIEDSNGQEFALFWLSLRDPHVDGCKRTNDLEQSQLECIFAMLHTNKRTRRQTCVCTAVHL